MATRLGTKDDEANRLAARIAERLGEPLTDEKIHAHFVERDRRGLPFTKVVARASVKLAYMVRPEHKGCAAHDEFDRLAGLPPRGRPAARRHPLLEQ
jgi:hypothetical protein